VFIAFDSSSLGDTIAWMPYVLEFKKKHECDVVVSTHKNFLFEKVYPELEFVNPGSTVNGIHGIKNFSKSLGPSDIYQEILIEELLKILMKQ
jgi:hypothetical protein